MTRTIGDFNQGGKREQVLRLCREFEAFNAPGVIAVDARNGFAQPALALAAPRLVERARANVRYIVCWSAALFIIALPALPSLLPAAASDASRK